MSRFDLKGFAFALEIQRVVTGSEQAAKPKQSSERQLSGTFVKRENSLGDLRISKGPEDHSKQLW